MGVGPVNQRPPNLPTVPQRWVFTLLRKHGAQTNTANGMSTGRCPQCNAPLTDNAATTCDYCGTQLGSGERDWVLASALTFEAWNVQENQRYQAAMLRRSLSARSACVAFSRCVHSGSTPAARFPAASTMAASAAAGRAKISTSPRRLSRNSEATSASLKKRADPNTDGEP